ncbi:hypothetical protein [Listeria sp. PSOL-1]|uniref:hypothetical protein n=1 Tax=Listeria sp. PSOL-1 TaxID=1844999 RepID=UPI0013D7B616|nr:hypothetical protein [Listeria sp. PSOL-1]
MKKLCLIVMTVLVGSSVLFFGGKAVNAASEPVLPSGYYLVKPQSNKNLQVNLKFQLGKLNREHEKFEFYYLPSKEAYIVNTQYGPQSIAWNGKLGAGNLEWKKQNSNDDKMLWTLEKTADNKYVIHNKKDPTMVWSLQCPCRNIGTPVQLEKADAQFSQQVFTIE